ncbi:hypothetical protein NEUTE1DRAFT_81988 [Neurospora tetrasperma FGSC 2508]|uniref:Uncharacterized protein n=1 Tax=Neurospora tetrasperma (strain FGSC 2508 / ATCC MYA-4615 / P0657) TaxID=510951 RepID=F8MMR1_NEUT8|nr:uncharacterized protein NEUTE1DRAFT_81988 [Neurospora tetrasperma FGSC 2508]EGO57935.1 hypothetical protein NEUTE1DRAFT_81988 [Neurospora tetrasperma FGSC 2508]EGZ71773.1 hypothetical protein NEUTE2DRAFT_110709 [Neurospora tetrasperma FGSC 2509]
MTTAASFRQTPVTWNWSARTLKTTTPSRSRQSLGFPVWVLLALLIIPSFLSAGTATAQCGADFVFPTENLRSFLLVWHFNRQGKDTLGSRCTKPCKTPGAFQEFAVDHATPGNGTTPFPLNFSSTYPCWLELQAGSGDCRVESSKFFILTKDRDPDHRLPATIGPSATVIAIDVSSTAIPGPPPHPDDHFVLGARIALGVGIALACFSVGAMAAFLYFRRRKKQQQAELANAIVANEYRQGRKGPEKKMFGGFSSSKTSSDGHLYDTVQPVFDGYPGSTGYDDVRSNNSSDIYGHSPVMSHSPSWSYNQGPWGHDAATGAAWKRSTERAGLGGGLGVSENLSITGRELEAARAKTVQPIPTSYGPNPVTPTLTPRASSRGELNERAAADSISLDSRLGVPPMPSMPQLSAASAAPHGGYYPDYHNYEQYTIPPPTEAPTPTPHLPLPSVPTTLPRPNPTTSQTQRAQPPLIISYGPNRVTPTPAVTSPTVPPDESMIERPPRGVELQGEPASLIERRHPWEDIDLPSASNNGPLPPYASTEEYAAMENGAIRKLEEPRAHAELPPTKDGYYHATWDIVEHELPGDGYQRDPLYPQASASGRGRDIDEQKFLLDDVEMAHLKAQKERIRAEMKKKQKQKETYQQDQGHDQDFLGESASFSTR